MSGEREEGGFLGRWSARKRAAGDTVRADGEREGRDETRDEAVGVSGPVGVDTAADLAAGVPSVVEADGDPVASGIDGTDGADGADGASPEPSRSSGSSSEPAREPARESASEPPPLTDADMPSIESLHADSDLSGFFSTGVSATLRRAALRHVFSLPRYNVRDGLNDYDGDYTVFEPLGDTVTSDMKFHAARRERERLEKERREAESVEAERLREEERLTEERLDDESPQEREPEREPEQARAEQARPEDEHPREAPPEETPSGAEPGEAGRTLAAGAADEADAQAPTDVETSVNV